MSVRSLADRDNATTRQRASIHRGVVAWSRRRGLRSDRDDGNLMLLAGIIVTIAFIMTALTLEQVGSLERQAASEPALTLAAEWRFIHDRVGGNLAVSITDTTKNATFTDQTFPAIAATFRAAEAEKGYDVTLRLAGASATVNKTEANVITKDPAVTGPLVYGVRNDDGSLAKVLSVEGTYDITSKPYDGVNDGLVWVTPCPATGSSNGCVSAVLTYVRLTDGTSALEEVMLFKVNQP
jgi:hypothetical protein